MKVSIVIVNYNGRKYIGECLDSVMQSNFKDFEIVVVENGSGDGSREYLQKQYAHKIKLVISKTNLFFTGGCNLGAKKAKGEWLVFLNADTVVEKNWLTEMVKLAKHKRLIQPKIKIYQTDKIDCVWGDYLWPGWGRAHGRGETDQGQYGVNRKIDYANGTCLMIEKKFFFDLGGFDENFKFFYEDVDLNLRARKQGGQAWYGAKAVIWHKGSLSFKQNVAAETVRYYYRRNRRLTVMKNFKGLDKRMRLTVLGWASLGMEHWINQIRIKEVKQLVTRKKFNWLDLGCGEGKLVKLLKEQGIKALGIDKKRGRSIETLQLKTKFEVISLYHVLEHVKDPEAVLIKIKQWLKPGGILVIEVPLVGNLTEKFLKKKYLAYLDKTHQHFWTKKEVKKLLSQTGWQIVKKKICWYEFPLTVITQGGWLGVLFWLPLKLLSIFGFNEEIIRVYCRKA